MKDHPDAELSEMQKVMAQHQEELEAFSKNWIAYQAKGNSEAIRYLVDHGVKVINMSSFLSKQLIQAEEDWEKIDDAFTYAADKDVIIVLGAGNHAQEVNDYPGNESKTIIAGASLLNDERWEEEIEMMKQKIKMGSCYGILICKNSTPIVPSMSISLDDFIKGEKYINQKIDPKNEKFIWRDISKSDEYRWYDT